MGLIQHRNAMTLVELLMVLSIVGVLAAVIIPAATLGLQYRDNTDTANHLRIAVQAFDLYKDETGSYPVDKNPAVTPPEMAGYYFPYFKIDDWWSKTTRLGGKWDWDNGYNFAYSVSISSPTVSASQLEDYDRLVDDGDLGTGRLRLVGHQLHFILEE